MIKVSYYESPCGRLALGEMEGRVCLCDWTVEPRHGCVLARFGAELVEESTPLLERLGQELDEYFFGERREFDLPLAAVYGTAFQRSVWEALMSVEYGGTLTYGGLAARMGRPAAVRAVASAVGANPMSILVPCHRIVGAGNKIGGYAGGAAAKRYLLELERR